MAGIIYFGANCALASISAFLPTIIKTFGYSMSCFASWYTSCQQTNRTAQKADALAQLLTIPPYAVAAVVLTGSSYLADRIQSRGLFVATGSAISSVGYVYVWGIICHLWGVDDLSCIYFYSSHKTIDHCHGQSTCALLCHILHCEWNVLEHWYHCCMV